ncbi:hypothetical protein [Sporisorium scitamineum]|uniref:Uncharacterized protein n=1 Tax=Sporisorium scitamineum TaxID=49012 RepID=A0A0F7S8D8_9BASI|nr:hypothetical protein [Sporisorium scitamineum]
MPSCEGRQGTARALLPMERSTSANRSSALPLADADASEAIS